MVGEIVNMKQHLSDDTIESLIIKGITSNKEYLALVMSSFEPQYFDNPTYKKMYEYCTEHYKTHLTVPSEFVLKDVLQDKTIFDEIKAIDFDIIKDYDFLVTETNAYLKDKAIKQAILDSVDVIKKGNDKNEIRDLMSKALAKDLKISLGLDY